MAFPGLAPGPSTHQNPLVGQADYGHPDDRVLVLYEVAVRALGPWFAATDS